MFFFGVDGPHADVIDQLAQAQGPEVEILQPDEEQPQGRVQGDGQDRGDDHGQGLGIGQGLEQPPFLGLQGQHRQEGNGDHQQGEKTGAGHLLDRLDDGLPVIPLPAGPVPLLQFFVRLFDHHDGRVHQGADGNGDPPQGHDVGADPQETEGDEGQKNGHGNGDQGNQGAGDVPEKEQDHQGHGDHDLDNGGLQVVYGPEDQVGAVIDRDDLHSGRQAGLDLLDFGLHPIDDVQGVLPLPHDHDPGDHLPFPVQVGDPPPDIRPQGHLPDVLDPDRGAAFAGGQDDFFKILQGLGIAPAPDGVLRPAELDQPAPHLHVPLAHRFRHPVDGDPVGLEPVGVHVHLVLLLEPAHRGHLGHARHRLEVVAQVPVLKGAQLGQTPLAGLIHQDILVDPAQTGGVRAQFGLDPGRKVGKDARKVFQGPGPRPVDVRPVLEDHIDIGVAEVGEAPDRLDLRGAQHGRDDGVGHLVFHDVRAAVPAGKNDDLGIAQVRDGVQGHMLHGPPARQAGGRHHGKDDELVPDRKIDDSVDHEAGIIPSVCKFKMQSLIRTDRIHGFGTRLDRQWRLDQSMSTSSFRCSTYV